MVCTVVKPVHDCGKNAQSKPEGSINLEMLKYFFVVALGIIHQHEDITFRIISLQFLQKRLSPCV